MDKAALGWEDIALQEAIKQKKLLRELDARNPIVKEARQCNYNIVESLNKSERTEESADEDKNSKKGKEKNNGNNQKETK